MDLILPQAPVPMFPLPGAFLFPCQALPLHIFEPRYRSMVHDLLDGPGRLVIAAIRGEVGKEPPAVFPVAGLGEIVRHERLPDGRFLIWVLGLTRVRLAEVPSDRPYRLVRCAPFDEVAVPVRQRGALTRQLRAAMQSRVQGGLPAGAPAALLADLLLQAIRPSQEVLARAFAEPSVLDRARFVLGQASAPPTTEA
ncbi:MAG: LON peptidase substrate-binding domain-containing protein [Planctomycetota bacterium]